MRFFGEVASLPHLFLFLRIHRKSFNWSHKIPLFYYCSILFLFLLHFVYFSTPAGSLETGECKNYELAVFLHCCDKWVEMKYFKTHSSITIRVHVFQWIWMQAIESIALHRREKSFLFLCECKSFKHKIFHFFLYSFLTLFPLKKHQLEAIWMQTWMLCCTSFTFYTSVFFMHEYAGFALTLARCAALLPNLHTISILCTFQIQTKHCVDITTLLESGRGKKLSRKWQKQGKNNVNEKVERGQRKNLW